MNSAHNDTGNRCKFVFSWSGSLQKMKENTCSMCNQINYSKHLLYILNCLSASSPLTENLSTAFFPFPWGMVFLSQGSRSIFLVCCCVGSCVQWSNSLQMIYLCVGTGPQNQSQDHLNERLAILYDLIWKAGCVKIETVWWREGAPSRSRLCSWSHMNVERQKAVGFILPEMWSRCIFPLWNQLRGVLSNRF